MKNRGKQIYYATLNFGNISFYDVRQKGIIVEAVLSILAHRIFKELLSRRHKNFKIFLIV